MTQTELEPLIQKAELDAGRFFATLREMERALVNTGRASDAATRNIAGSWVRVGAAFQSPLASITALRASIVGLGSALGVTQIVRYADSYRGVQNSLRVAGIETENLTAATDELFDIAIRTRAPVADLAQLFQRLSIAGQELGLTQREVAQATELTGRAIAVGGGSVEAARGALFQFGQAVSSARVRMEEFNSIQEGALPILRAVAAGLAEAGGSVTTLRRLVLEGQVSGEAFFRAYLAGSAEIEEAFARTESTVGQALTNLNTAFTELVGKTDESSGGTRRLAAAINDLAAAMGDPVFQEFARDFAAEMAAGAASTIREITRIKEAIQDLGDFFGSVGDITADIDLASQADEATRRIAEIREEIATLMRDLAAGARTDEMKRATMDQIEALQLEESTLREVIARYRERAAAVPMPELDAGLRVPPESQRALIEGVARLGAGPPKPVSTRDFPAGGSDAATKTTFADIIGRLEREVALTKELALTREQISAVLGAERTLKRQLTAEERSALIAATATVDQLREAADLEEKKADAARDFKEELTGQIAESQALIAAGGQETEAYRIHIGLLEAKRTLLEDLTDEERRLVAAAAQAETRARTSTALAGMRAQTRQAEFQTRHAAGVATMDVLGLPPPEDYLEGLKRLELESQGIKITPQVDFQIEQMVEAQQQLELMTETAPELANTLGQLGQIAVFEGLEEAGQRFLEMLVDMLFQMIALQLIMASIGMISGTPTTAPPPGTLTGMGMPFAGPRQRGGPVRGGEAVIVGERGPELFVPRTTGEILSNPDTTRLLASQPRMLAGGTTTLGGGRDRGTNISVNVINNASNAQVSTRQDEDTGRLDIMIDEMIAGNLKPGTATARAMRDRYGLSFQTRR